MRKSRKRSKRRVSRRRVSRRRVSKHRSRRRVRVSRGFFRYNMDEEPLIDMCPVCQQEGLELIPFGCGGGRHGVCNKCIVPTILTDTRCPLCRDPGPRGRVQAVQHLHRRLDTANTAAAAVAAATTARQRLNAQIRLVGIIHELMRDRWISNLPDGEHWRRWQTRRSGGE